VKRVTLGFHAPEDIHHLRSLMGFNWVPIRENISKDVLFVGQNRREKDDAF
jgi:hypothetical protein